MRYFQRLASFLILISAGLQLMGQNAPDAPNPTTIRTKLIIATIGIVLITGYTIMKVVKNNRDQ